MSMSFVQDKIAFFQNSIAPGDTASVRAHFESGNIEKKFKFLSDNRRSIEHEFNELDACLDRNGENRHEFWLFCYYTSFLLQTYYETYNPEQAYKYKKACADIEKRFAENNFKPRLKEVPLLEMLNNDLNEVVSTPFSVAKLRKLVGEINVQRLSTRFSLLTLKQSLLLADQWHLLDNLQAMLGRQINIAILDAPLGVYNALSVALCGIRLVFDLGMLAKHTWFPVGLESELTAWDRASVEIQQHYYHLANDMIWSTVNALCNYGAYFHVAAPVASVLMVGFTVFDIFWLNYLLIQVRAVYALEKSQREDYKNTLLEGTSAWRMADDQLKQLERNAEKDKTTLEFYLAAACILECGFLAAFILAPPAFMPVCLLLCNIAIAMYLSGDKYGVYKEKCLAFTPAHHCATQGDVDDAWNDLMGTMVKNTVMPFIILGAFTLSVPAAAVLTLAYTAHERGLTAYLPKVMDYFTDKAAAPNMG